jgi:cyanobactin maturation PatA/PatG family protease
MPVFADRGRRLSQLDLCRAIEQAIESGAHIINISGGQLTEYGEAEDWLKNAVRLCQESNVLIIAAAGNDGCECLHVPAALPTALAVGAMDDLGKPMNFSNWGEAYQDQGILAPGENILGALPGGHTIRLSGTSCATPIVTGVAALLLSLQLARGEKPDPHKVRAAILESAIPCDVIATDDRDRCLVGKLNIPGAEQLILGGKMSDLVEAVNPSACSCGVNEQVQAMVEQVQQSLQPTTAETTEAMVAAAKPLEASSVPEASSPPPAFTTPAPQFSSSSSTNSVMPNKSTSYVTASQAPSELANAQLVYALGTLGYDFGSEARRDSFKQLMPAVAFDNTAVPANPYDARQMVDYLESSPSEARSLIWTLNLELTPIYAIEPVGPFAREVYGVLQELLAGQIQAETSEDYVERVSIPGVLTGKTVKLFSGQVLPVIEPQNTRGLYGWKVNTLVAAALRTVGEEEGTTSEDRMRRTLESFLNRIYYDLRNLGTTSQDRALNFAATNAFQAATTFSQAVAAAMELDSISVEKSPFCRMDSDCWDVKLKFFDPENSRRAKKVFRFTIDVSDVIPVTLGDVKTWSTPY